MLDDPYLFQHLHIHYPSHFNFRDSHSRHSHENSDSWHGRRGKDHGRELPRGRSPRGRRQERDWRRSNNFLEDQRSRDGMDPRSRDNMNPRSRDKMDSRSRDNLDPRSRDNMDSRSRDNLDNAESGDHWPDFKEPERRFPDLESRHGNFIALNLIVFRRFSRNFYYMIVIRY